MPKKKTEETKKVYKGKKIVDINKIKKEAKEKVKQIKLKEQGLLVEEEKLSEFDISLQNKEEEAQFVKSVAEVIASNDDEEKKKELLSLLEILDGRKKNYRICETKLQPHQEQVIGDVTEMMMEGGKSIPKNKYILFQGGNGAGKTILLMYIIVLLALGERTKKYKLPYIGTRKNIRIVTESSANVSGTFQPYLIGEYSKTRIPPEEIKKIVKDNGVLKEIHLENGCNISIRTYDQGRKRVQGGNPDFIGVDEEPTKEEIWYELLARVREPVSQMLISMTPLSGHTPVYRYFYEGEPVGIDRRKKYLVSSLDNKHADHSGLLMLPEEERKMRIYGQFVPPSGLVYRSFYRQRNVVKHFHPKELGDDVKYYAGLDFGVAHPTAFLLVAQDGDENTYIFDGFKKSNLLLTDIKKEILSLVGKYDVKLEYIVADSAAKRERTELKALGIDTKGADKFSKGENNESNRKAGILKINTMFHNNKLFISENLIQLIDELEKHGYKDGNKDGEVVKENDDMLDAMRYCIFSFKKTKIKSEAEKRFEEKWGKKHNKQGHYNYKNTY